MCVCAGGTSGMSACRGQRTTLQSCFSLSTFMWVLGVKLWLSGYRPDPVGGGACIRHSSMGSISGTDQDIKGLCLTAWTHAETRVLSVEGLWGWRSGDEAPDWDSRSRCAWSRGRTRSYFSFHPEEELSLGRDCTLLGRGEILGHGWQTHAKRF